MARVFALVLAIGLIPLAVGAIVIQRARADREARTLDRALTADANAGTADLLAYFDRARAIALLTAENPAFRDFYALHAKSRRGDRAYQRVVESLQYLERLYPDALAEACFIDSSGRENARVVKGIPARPSDLSPDESKNPFFYPTFGVGEGHVYQADPYVSPDTAQWVISNSTVVPMKTGAQQAIVHFEISVESLRRTLAKEQGHHLLVVDQASGAVVLDSRVPQRDHVPLGRVDRRFTPAARASETRGVLTHDGLRFAYVHMPRGGTNANDWVIVATSPAPRPELFGLSTRTLVLLLALLVVVALAFAYRWARLSKDLDQSERRYRVLFEEAEAGRRLLAEQNDRLRQLDRMKDDFVASVSHELRTPLTSINGYVELLLEGEVNREQQEFLQIVQRNGERLLRLVGDLLFAAELDAKTVELNRASVDLVSLVAHARDAARPLADERGIELSLEASPVSTVHGDAGRLGQAIDNLLSNALKFTPPGGRVTLRLFEDGDGVTLEVRDTGMGISEDDQAQLFERFFRTSEATSAAIQGTGLGLSIVAGIVEAHGGSIGVESDVGFGTTFRISLPYARSEVAA